MKTIKFFLTIGLTAILLLRVGIQSSFATNFDPHSVEIPAFFIRHHIAPKKVNIYMPNLQKRRTKVWIEDNKGKVIFKTTVTKRNAYGKTFNMESLEDGIYRIILEQGKGQRIVEPFRIGAD